MHLDNMITTEQLSVHHLGISDLLSLKELTSSNESQYMI